MCENLRGVPTQTVALLAQHSPTVLLNMHEGTRTKYLSATTVQWYDRPPLIRRHLIHFTLFRHAIKDKVWGAFSKREARCLMKMAAKSGNVGVFNKAKEAVLLRGTVSTGIMSSTEHQDCNLDPPAVA